MFAIEYEVEDAGWAYAKITTGEKSINIRISYLHDTLKELAEAALHIIGGGTSARVIFMDEPGEHQLIFTTVKEKEIHFSLRWFDDWESWGMCPSDKYEKLLEGNCSINRIKHQVTNVLWKIYENLGEEKYLELWCEHPFPTKLYKKLQNA